MITVRGGCRSIYNANYTQTHTIKIKKIIQRYDLILSE